MKRYKVKYKMEEKLKSEYRWCNGLKREMRFYIKRKKS